MSVAERLTSAADTEPRTRVPIAPWGWGEINIGGWPLLIVAIALVLAGSPWHWLAIVPMVLLVWLVSFFRDPPRRISDDARAIVAPADGKIVDITPLENYDFIGGPAVRIGIFLSIFNVHINRAPLNGRVIETHYHPGEFLSATRPESAERNEYMWIGFEQTEPPQRRFAVRQISGMLARRIVCTLAPGQTITRGQKFGMIKLGSRTELILPAGSADIAIKVGDRIRAGSDVVAHWRD
ncbi:MAG TPA: phosphatidylserine decarboxylase [Lacipirellulaceae bacterium]|nr:phosphatidylserine decarboxylase [Lacipirellulaceae bacterium]